MNRSHRVVALVVSLMVLGAFPALLSAGEHPTVFFTKKDLPALRERIKQKPLSDWYAKVRENADALLDKPLEKITGYDSRWGSVDLALVYSITGDKKYADKARDILLDVNQEHLKLRLNKIYQGYAGSAYPVAYDMIYPALTPAERKKIRDAFVDSLESLHGGYPYANIWLVRAGGGGLAGLAFDLPEWVEGAKRAFKAVYSAGEEGPSSGGKTSSFLGGVKKGGAFIEGQSYGVMGAIQIAPFLVALKRNGGEDLFKHPTYREYLDQSVLSLSPTGTIHRFEDSGIGASRGNAEILYTAAANAPSPEEGGLWLWGYDRYVERDGEGRTPQKAEAITVLTWREPTVKPIAPKVVSWIAPKSGLAFLRSGWEKDDLHLAMTCKPYYHMHMHRDENSVEVWAYGALLLALPGYPGYNAPHHFDWAVTTEAANTIKINDKDQIGGNDNLDNAADGFTGHLLDGPVEYVSGDASRLYAGAKFVRNVVFVKPTPTVPGYYVLLDNITTEKPTDKVDWLLHGRGTMKVEDQRVVWTVNSFTDKKPVSVQVDILAPKVQIEQKEGWLDFERKNIPYIRASHEGSADYLAVLYPARPEQKVPVSEYGQTDSGAIAKIGGTDIFAFSRKGDIKSGDLSTDAGMCFVRTRNGADLALCFATRTKRTSYAGRLCFASDVPANVSLEFQANVSFGVVELPKGGSVTILAGARPKSVHVNGAALPPDKFSYDDNSRTVSMALSAGRHMLKVGSQ